MTGILLSLCLEMKESHQTYCTYTHTRKTYNSTHTLWKRDACFGSKQSSSASALPSLRKKTKLSGGNGTLTDGPTISKRSQTPLWAAHLCWTHHKLHLRSTSANPSVLECKFFRVPTLGERSHEEVVEIASHLGELPLAPFPALAHLGAAVLEVEVRTVMVL